MNHDISDLMTLLCLKWVPPILMSLQDAPKRPGELCRQMPITKKVLSQTLKELQAHGLVARETKKLIPLHVEYSLTDTGLRVCDLVALIHDWAVRNADVMRPGGSPEADAEEHPREPHAKDA